jgi:cytochrome c
MRRLGLMLVATLAGASLAACGKSGGGQATGSEGQATPPASAPAPAELTDAQKQKLTAELPAPYNAGDIAHGKSVFMICKSCHTTVSGAPNMTGPNLYGVFGRKAGTAAGFTYSDGLKASGITWDAAHIDTWITNPKAVVADTKMSFVGLKDPKDRTDLIAYLKTEVSPAP